MAIVVGTAGHIDHGKTALVKALTGIDTDRLPIEKQRGITTELGFAPLELAGQRIAMVDVPGHERFVKSMVAGATGIDVVVRPGHALTEDEVVEYCRRDLADYKRPRKVVFLSELPRNLTGKVLKRELRELTAT